MSEGEAPGSPPSAALCKGGAGHSAASEHLGKVKTQLRTAALTPLFAHLLVLPKSRVSGQTPVPAVAPGLVGELGVGFTTGHVLGELLQMAWQRLASVLGREAGGSSGLGGGGGSGRRPPQGGELPSEGRWDSFPYTAVSFRSLVFL